MVDFQSRDTQRGVSDDADEGAEEADATDAESPAAAGETADTAGDPATADATDDVATQKGFALVSVGTDRTIEEDATGNVLVEEIDAAGGHVAVREVIDASYDGVQQTVEALVDRGDVTAVVTAGATGVEPDDVTPEAVESMFDRDLPGFGEILRIMCFDDQGSSVIRTRAIAGTIEGVPVFCLPGDPAVAERGVRELVLPEAETIAELAGPETPE